MGRTRSKAMNTRPANTERGVPEIVRDCGCRIYIQHSGLPHRHDGASARLAWSARDCTGDGGHRRACARNEGPPGGWPRLVAGLVEP